MKIYPSIQAISADAGYRKTFEKDVLDNYDIPVDISTKINGEWKIIPKRWIVERNFAWMNNFRRLTKDFEITVKSAESFVKIAHIAQILRMLKMTENALTQSYCFGNDIIRIQREFDLLRILSLLSAP